jgi:pyruvate-formate lyase
VTDRFKQQIKEVERKVIEANQCCQFMHKNVKFSQELISVMPDTFRLDSTSPADVMGTPRQEI